MLQRCYVNISNCLVRDRRQFSPRITAQKLKFSIKDFFSKCDQICSFPWIWSHLLKKSLMENFIFCAVQLASFFPWFFQAQTGFYRLFFCHPVLKTSASQLFHTNQTKNISFFKWNSYNAPPMSSRSVCSVCVRNQKEIFCIFILN